MLTVITGPMFAGKSSALISKGISHIIAGDCVVAFKPSIDDRYDTENITTHYGDKFSAYVVNSDSFFNEAYECFKKYDRDMDVILIDEAQFFNRVQILRCINEWIEWSHVIVAGLAQDSSGRPFGAMPDILALADNIICLKAVCSRCKKVNSATRTFSKIKLKSKIVVGGSDIYEPRCFGCWNEI